MTSSLLLINQRVLPVGLATERRAAGYYVPHSLIGDVMGDARRFVGTSIDCDVMRIALSSNSFEMVNFEPDYGEF